MFAKFCEQNCNRSVSRLQGKMKRKWRRALGWAVVLCAPAQLSLAFVPASTPDGCPWRPGNFLCSRFPRVTTQRGSWPALRAADGDDAFDIQKMCVLCIISCVSARFARRGRLTCALLPGWFARRTLEEIEALPELGEYAVGEEDRPPMVEELMAEDARFGMKMRALRGDFAP